MAALQRYRWPGNVRELQNVIERAVLLGKSEPVRLDDLPNALIAAGPVRIEPAGNRTLKQAMEAPERQIILEVLDSTNWNRHATAELLGINRTTLYKKMKRLGLEEPAWRWGGSELGLARACDSPHPLTPCPSPRGRGEFLLARPLSHNGRGGLERAAKPLSNRVRIAALRNTPVIEPDERSGDNVADEVEVHSHQRHA